MSDQDSEMLAIKAIAQALDPLDRNASKRVLEWATAKYLGGANGSGLIADLEQGFFDMLERVQKAAQKSDTSWPALISVVERVVRESAREADEIRERREIEAARV